jgi:hypothetical protein
MSLLCALVLRQNPFDAYMLSQGIDLEDTDTLRSLVLSCGDGDDCEPFYQQHGYIFEGTATHLLLYELTHPTCASLASQITFSRNPLMPRISSHPSPHTPLKEHLPNPLVLVVLQGGAQLPPFGAGGDGEGRGQVRRAQGGAGGAGGGVIAQLACGQMGRRWHMWCEEMEREKDHPTTCEAVRLAQSRT